MSGIVDAHHHIWRQADLPWLMGPLQPRIPEVLRTPSGMIELAPQAIVEDAARLGAARRGAGGRHQRRPDPGRAP